MVYRYYHRSFKVYNIQRLTLQIVKTLEEVGEGMILNPQFLLIIKKGTEKTFRYFHNKRWNVHTLPQLQAFWHAK